MARTSDFKTSPTKLAQLLGISRQRIHQILNDTNDKNVTKKLLLLALNLDEDTLRTHLQTGDKK